MWPITESSFLSCYKGTTLKVLLALLGRKKRPLWRRRRRFSRSSLRLKRRVVLKLVLKIFAHARAREPLVLYYPASKANMIMILNFSVILRGCSRVSILCFWEVRYFLIAVSKCRFAFLLISSLSMAPLKSRHTHILVFARHLFLPVSIPKSLCLF